MTDAKSTSLNPSSGANVRNVLEISTIYNRSGARMTNMTDVTAKQN
jgi:hypothetical protein